MIKFRVKQFGFTIKFYHWIDVDDDSEPGTDCYISVFDTSYPLFDKPLAFSNGKTLLHENDQYSRPFGRRLSFARAVQTTLEGILQGIPKG